MNTLLIKLAGAACILASYALFGSSAYAAFCWECHKHENNRTLMQPAHANTCAPGGNCTTCEYYSKPEYDCKPVPRRSDCTVTHGVPVLATVYEANCLAGASCRCPSKGIPQSAGMATTGDTCK